ncbi:MAG: hypothetical protein WA964_13390, partial [Ilumatobacter sp.]|uniref:hypothetical protein n=1 Tax=Ilumatobacter sp. TaxID=1967498 RepID=UPI003C759870
LPVMAYGVIYSTWLIVGGALIVTMSMFGWALEPADASPDDFDPPDTTPSSSLVSADTAPTDETTS